MVGGGAAECSLDSMAHLCLTHLDQVHPTGSGREEEERGGEGRGDIKNYRAAVFLSTGLERRKKKTIDISEYYLVLDKMSVGTGTLCG